MPKKTVGDKLVNFYTEYIAITKKKVDTKTKKLLTTSNYDPLLGKQGYIKLSPIKRRELSQQSPILMKGIKKKNMDIFRAWFKVEAEKDRGNPVATDLDALKRFEKRSRYKAKLYEAGECSDVYGDGFLLITFLNDEHKEIHEPVDVSSEPYDVKLLNPEHITEMKYYKGELCYYYDDTVNMKEDYIHPDRIQHIVSDKLPFSKFGLSKIDLLRHTIESKKNIDIAAGKILSWFSHGILDMEWEGMTPEEQEEMIKVAAQHPGAYIHDEDVKIDIKNPKAIDPKPFYDYVILNIAAALNMPTHILTGVQVGRVTGSEIGYADYYRDVHDMQDLVYQPLIEDLYKRIIEAKGRKWKYELEWNAIYIDEGTEAKLLESRVNSATKAKTDGVIDNEEARSIINKGLIELDPSKKIKVVIPKAPPFPANPNKPNPAPSPSRSSPPALKNQKEDMQVVIRGGLSDEERAMIKRCRKAEANKIKKEKELGKKILKEQEEEKD